MSSVYLGRDLDFKAEGRSMLGFKVPALGSDSPRGSQVASSCVTVASQLVTISLYSKMGIILPVVRASKYPEG